MKKFEVTITRTGSIIVEAETADEAFDKVLEMTTHDIDISADGNLTGWEPSDVEEIREDENMTNEIKVKVEGGMITAEPSYDPNYPGINIEFVPDAGNTAWENAMSYPRALMEKPNGGKLRLLLWMDSDDEDYTHNFEIRE